MDEAVAGDDHVALDRKIAIVKEEASFPLVGY